ncbi:MAG: CpaF family protein [Clostridiales bacterium]|nr:CpaF family protein [Clostridiales bacterium]
MKILEELRKEVIEGLDSGRGITDEEIFNRIDEVLIKKSKISYFRLDLRIRLRKEIFDSIRGLDVLQDLLEDPSITEIMINGYQTIFVEREGKLYRYERGFYSKERLSDVIQQMVAKANRRVNESSPIVDSRLEDGSRVNVVLDPIAINGPIVTIRKFPEEPITMKELIGWEAITHEVAEVLRDLVEAGYNIFVCGGTGSGKTTFLNAMSNFIPKEERIITIEDSAELQIKEIENLVRLEVRSANSSGDNEITIRDLIKTSLRMRPSRIIVGEIRGGEALDLLQALNTGHDGSMSTGHGNSPRDMLSRIETMVLMGIDMPLPAIRSQIAAALDVIIYLGRLRDKSRRVLEIVEVLGYKNEEIGLNPLYEFVETGENEKGRIEGWLEGDKGKLINRKKLERAGIRW